MIRHQLAARLDRSDPVRIVCLVALVATHGLVRLTERYLPAYAVDLGYGPIVVGGLATLGLGVGAVVAERAATTGGREPARDGAHAPAASVAAADASETREGQTTRSAAGTSSIPRRASLLAAAGLCIAAAAGTLDALLGTPLSTLGWLALGVAALQPWHAIGPGRSLWPHETLVPPAPGGRSPQTTASESESTRRGGMVVGGVSVAVAAIVAWAAAASADGLVAAVALLATVGAALALVSVIALGTNPREGGRGVERSRSNGSGDGGSGLREESSVERVRSAVARLPAADRPAIVGDALVRVAIAGIAPFLVLLVVDRGIGLSVGPFSIEPVGAFALFVLVEAAGAILGALVSVPFAERVDRRAMLVGGLVILSLVPVIVVASADRPALVAAAFCLFGFRTAIDPLRPTVGLGERSAPILDSAPPAGLRSALRLALVPAPLVAGVAYAIDPLVAFTAATTTGVLGVRELSRAFDFGGGR